MSDKVKLKFLIRCVRHFKLLFLNFISVAEPNHLHICADSAPPTGTNLKKRRKSNFVLVHFFHFGISIQKLF